MPPSQLDFKGYLNLIKRRKELFLILTSLLMTFAFAVSYLLPKKYVASSTVFIQKNMIGEVVKGISVTTPVEDTINVLTYTITSRWLVTRAVDALGLAKGLPENQREAMIKSLQHRMTVKLKEKNLFTITFSDSDPRRARDFVNTLVRMYIQENVSAKLGQSYDAANFLSQQITLFSAKLEKADERVNAYKRRMGGLISLDEGRLSQEVGAAQQKLYDLQLRRRQLVNTRKVMRGGNALQVKLAALQKKQEELLTQYTDSYPDVIILKAEIESVREQLRGQTVTNDLPPADQEMAKIDAEIAAIRSSEEVLGRYIASNNALLSQMPAAKAGLEKLETERQNEKKMYDLLSTRQDQSEVSKQMEAHEKAATFRVVDPAILPLVPTSPNRLKIMLIGMVAAAGGSFGTLLLFDHLDDSVKDSQFVKGLEPPLLAVIPRLHDPAVVARERRRSLWVLPGATAYLLFMLCFPALEFLGLPYMDRFLEQVHPSSSAQGGTGLVP